jgi:flagellar hook-basal body complex protein FliE
MAIQPVSSSPLSTVQGPNSLQKTSASDSTQQVSKTFEEMLDSLNQSQLNADGLMQQLAQGENVDLHSVMIGMEENNVNFNVAMGIRDRLVDAYREIMRMQV